MHGERVREEFDNHLAAFIEFWPGGILKKREGRKKNTKNWGATLCF